MNKEKFGSAINKYFKYSLGLGIFVFAIISYIIFGDVSGSDLQIVMTMLKIFAGLLVLMWLALFFAEIFYVLKFKDRSRLANFVLVVAIFLMMVYLVYKAFNGVV
ncbi:MAG: hypothetical protein Q4E36_06470 [Bacillota bacterium]|nr:hypothetical protein [Bacillota bacterium]